MKGYLHRQFLILSHRIESCVLINQRIHTIPIIIRKIKIKILRLTYLSNSEGSIKIPHITISTDTTAHARQNGSVIFLFASDRIAITRRQIPIIIKNIVNKSPNVIFPLL